ncbi:hypothetical protein D9619_000901 [Psilocybe cf. subviscida]|uniref:Beta-catenin-like protein 1 N-terminal domain-containing protein n=1 Tax=Psilocybe cf. subviscida TaxID=2480587 RepID=A0A8H5F3H7_9AGAR|nr:hypothetical protein D9619_000901 [Psilocybe cf. subviscida]
MDIDSLFKVPKLPVTGNKRKLPDNPSPELLKKLKMEGSFGSDSSSSRSSANTDAPNGKYKATVEDMDMDEDEQPFAPGGDADYFAEEDEDGRFYGGGLTSEQKDILNIFDKAEGEPDEDDEMSITKIRRLLQAFERAANKNQDQRSKYPDDPSKFIDSEADLDGAIKALLPLSQSSGLAYPELARSNAMPLLIGLLSHENLDIVIDAVELLYELTEENADAEYDDDEVEEEEAALKILVDSLVEHSCLELLVDNLSRLNEAEESDRQGVFHVLGIFENTIGFNPALATTLASKTNVLAWLLNRIQAKTHDDNRGYAAELLSILLQNSTGNKILFGEKNGVETLLSVLSQFRRRDPVDAEETEFMENLFDALCSAMSDISVKKLFLEAEGCDLMVLMMKEKRESKSRSIKVLDYSMSGTHGAPVCEAFVEAAGIKTLFAAFMGKASKRQKATNDSPASQDTAHILGIVSSLLTNLPSDSPSRIRVLAKFVEGEYEKIDKLVELRDAARKRLKATEMQIEKEKSALEDGNDQEELDELLYIRRLEGGLFTLQTLDYILAWLIMEDDGMKTHALKMLGRGNQTLEDILATLRIYRDHVDEEPASEEGDTSISQRDILQGLIEALQS